MIQFVCRDRRICISNKFPADVVAAALGTPLWYSLLLGFQFTLFLGKRQLQLSGGGSHFFHFVDYIEKDFLDHYQRL